MQQSLLFRHNRVKLGLCAHCPEKRNKWAWLCDACQEKHRKRQRDNYAVTKERRKYRKMVEKQIMSDASEGKIYRRYFVAKVAGMWEVQLRTNEKDVSKMFQVISRHLTEQEAEKEILKLLRENGTGLKDSVYTSRKTDNRR